MSVQDETVQTVVTVTAQVTKLGEALLKILAELAAQLKEQKKQSSYKSTGLDGKSEVKVKTGKMSLRDLDEKGQTDYVDVTNKDELKQLKKLCNKNHIDYSVLANKKTEPPTYTFFFKAADMNIIKKFVQDAVKDLEKEEKNRQAERAGEQREDQNREQHEEQREEQREEKRENQKEEKPDASREDSGGNNVKPENSREKNRETMGSEEREKEEPVKTPETEPVMPTKAAEPVRSTDDVKREQREEREEPKKEQEKSETKESAREDVSKMTDTQKLWADAEKQSFADARESYLRTSAALDGPKTGSFHTSINKMAEAITEKHKKDKSMPSEVKEQSKDRTIPDRSDR